MYCIWRRTLRRAGAGSPVICWPANDTDPAVARIKPMIARPVVVLPQPDSPTKTKGLAFA